ncbi:MAG: glutaconyl-CoA decarboxylase subunit alpha [Deltaproteobacteria bacterium]|nr:glutaconyl-CoA decarboxylase subunit alpha [Deltaproteobacteria bacterium]
MKPYFEKMNTFGRPLKQREIARSEENIERIRALEAALDQEVNRIKTAGISAEKINQRGQLTAWQRIEYLVDEGSWRPLHTLFDPEGNEEGTTGVIDGLSKVGGKWAVVIASNNQVLAGAWIKGQAENVLRVTDLAKRLRVPLIWILNCSGVKLTEQDAVYPGRRSGGTPLFRHARLNQLGVPILVGIYGTNPAGGGYQGISPTVLFAHHECNVAVGGAGIVGGMSPKGNFDLDDAERIIQAQSQLRENPPGRVEIHRNETGFFRYVYQTEEGVLDAIREYMKKMPAYDPEFFRVAEPKEPRFACDEISRIIPVRQNESYAFEQVAARIFDGSEHMEFKPNYGPEVYCGLVKLEGLPVGCIGNRLGLLPRGYPEYADYPGVGGKLYRQGLIKMNEFVTLCSRDRIPIVWFQDTTGVDVGDQAEKAELLGLGQSLIYSIQQSEIAMMLVVLRKGTAAAHYLMGGPTANDHNAFTLGTPTTEIYVMHGETAAVASYSRRLEKEKKQGAGLQPVIDQMNRLARQYHERSRADYCARRGFVDEVVRFQDLRKYLVAFASAVYQNPVSVCPVHQMLTPRVIRG